MMKQLLFLSLMWLANAALAQQSVYRCTVNGQTVYSQTACRGGTAVAVDDTRTEAQRRAAAEAQKKEEKRLQAAARDREVREKRSANLQAAHIPYRDAQEAAKYESSYGAKLKAMAKRDKSKKKKSSRNPSQG